MNEIRWCLGSLDLSSVQILSPSKIQELYKSFIFLWKKIIIKLKQAS